MNENMKERKDQRLLVFIHIPKTGGMTLHQIIKRQYAEDQVCNIRKNAEEEFRGLPEGEKRKIRYLRWHTRFEMPRKMTLLQRFHCRWHTRFVVGKNLPTSSDFVTIVRDPVERIISQYYHALTCSDERFNLYRYITDNKMSFKDYVESGIRPIFDQQTRFLTGREESSSDDLMIAKANLEKYFKVVGVLERFDETLLILKKTFGWRDVFYIKENVTRNRPSRSSIPEDVIHTIQEKNPMDTELHRFARERLERSIREYGHCFKNDLLHFRDEN